MITFTPRTAIEASRLIRCVEAAKQMNALLFWNGDGTATIDNMKVNEDGKRVKSRYEIDLNKLSCACPDWADHRNFCKHLIYAEGIATDVNLGKSRKGCAHGWTPRLRKSTPTDTKRA